jgi:hypothetical protein
VRREELMRDITFDPLEVFAADQREGNAPEVVRGRIDKAEADYPNLLAAIGFTAAQLALIEPAFQHDRELCIVFIMHTQTLVAEALAYLDRENAENPLVDKEEA